MKYIILIGEAMNCWMLPNGSGSWFWWDWSRTSKRSILFYAVCFLYVLSAATFVTDLLAVIFQVSNNSICKNTFLYISCADTSRDTIGSTSNWLRVNDISHYDCPTHSKRLLWLPCPMHSSTHTKPLYPSSVLLTQIFKDLPLLDRVGSRYSCRDHSFILGNRILRSVIILSSFDNLISIYRF